jgi:putative tryptophan/tyrosine transport system substrate-binding protein
MCGYENAKSALWSVPLVVLLVSGGLVTGSRDAAGQARPIHIGTLNPSWGPVPPEVGLRDGLQELGYRENKDFVLGIRFTQGNTAALPAAARELVQFGADIIFASTQSAATAAQKATTRLPIVFAIVSDPLGSGLVESFARPGGNVTGVADLSLELGPKRLELFQQIIPGLKRVLFIYAATDAISVKAARVYRDAARKLGIELVEKAVRTEEEAQSILAGVQTDEIDGILGAHQPPLNINGFIMEGSAKRAIPTMFTSSFFVESGGLASYGPNLYETGRQAARLVDKIIKGTSPAEIPVEVNTKIEFAINLKVAKALGLKIPAEALYRADKVIK